MAAPGYHKRFVFASFCSASSFSVATGTSFARHRDLISKKTEDLGSIWAVPRSIESGRIVSERQASVQRDYDLRVVFLWAVFHMIPSILGRIQFLCGQRLILKVHNQLLRGRQDILQRPQKIQSSGDAILPLQCAALVLDSATCSTDFDIWKRHHPK